MPEWLESLLTAIGGGAVVLVGVFTIFKGLLFKFLEKGIESSFEKKVEKFKNNLERSTRAYEIILDRKIQCYKELEPITAELIPIEHDLLYCLKYDEEVDREKRCEEFKTYFERYYKLTKELKQLILIHQSYIPLDIFRAYASVVQQMQDDMQVWHDMAKLLFAGEYGEIDYKKCEIVKDELLKKLAYAELLVRKHLTKLSGESDN